MSGYTFAGRKVTEAAGAFRDERQRKSVALFLPAALVTALALIPAQSRSAPTDDAGSQEVGEIIVTAQRRAEASVDVPITVTTLDPERLTTANVNQLSDTVRLTTALRFDSQGPAVQPTIRGIGTAVTTSGGGPNVGIYVDGFFTANTYVNDFQLMKVENIQVLKGPQGTLFGRNTTGGAILVTTADPSMEPSAEVAASYGRFNAMKMQGYATTGLTDNIAMDIEGVFQNGDSFKTNLLNEDDTIGEYENWSVRTGLKIEISPTVSAVFRYIHSQTDDPVSQLVNAYVDRDDQAEFFSQVSPAGQAIYGRSSSAGQPLVYFYAPSGTYVTAPDDVVMNDRIGFQNNSDSVQATVKADLGFADLTSYTQYRRDYSPYYGDLDATALPFFNLFVGVEDDTVSQEFLLTSKPGSRLQWTTGANYFTIEDTWDVGASLGGAPFMPFGGSSTRTTSYALFLDGTYDLTDKLSLTAGVRYSYDEVTDAYFLTNPFTAFYTGPDGSIIPVNPAVTPPGSAIPTEDIDHDQLTPRFVLSYKPTDDSSIYASYTRGYKAGILNVGGLSQVPVKPEKISAYEIGYKYDDRILAFDLAGYVYNYRDLQFSSYQNGAAQIRNAQSSDIYGLEAQVRYRATDTVMLYGGLGWTHAEYDSFENAPYYNYCDPSLVFNPLLPDSHACVPIAMGGSGPGALTQVTRDASGLQMQRSPEYTANLGASYDMDLAGGVLTLSGNLYFSSSFYFDANEQFKQGGYEVLTLRAQWVDPSERYTITVFGDNVTDERYQTQVLFSTLGIASVWNAPASYGVTVSAKF